MIRSRGVISMQERDIGAGRAREREKASSTRFVQFKCVQATKYQSATHVSPDCRAAIKPLSVANRSPQRRMIDVKDARPS
eukprot:4799160-Pleurochrysis_carterae.AAC.2